MSESPCFLGCCDGNGKNGWRSGSRGIRRGVCGVFEEGSEGKILLGTDSDDEVKMIGRAIKMPIDCNRY